MIALARDAARGQSPRALIVTIYGLYARELGGWLSVAALIRLLAELDVAEPAVRSAISRLKRRELLVAERVDGAAGYALSERGRAILAEGDRRIFARERGGRTDGWVLAVFSIPEAERDRRHQLRSRLARLGFGTVAAGVWIAPAHLYDDTRDMLTSNGLADYVDLFRADHQAFRQVREQVPRWWDLDRLHELYAEFLTRNAPVLARVRRRRGLDGRAAFVAYVPALTDWRRLPYADPGLAPELLPRRWNGIRAADTFFELHDRLAPAAHRYVTDVTASPSLSG